VRIAQLLKRLNFLYEIEAQKEGVAKEEISKVNADLQTIADEIKEGNLIRAKIKNLEKTENSAEFYARTEINNAENKHIEALNIGGTLCAETPQIINHCLSFYSDLYNKREVDRSVWPSLTQHLTRANKGRKSNVRRSPHLRRMLARYFANGEQQVARE
jgi:SepF-like predicted cell division protein (DUF552 family)